MKTKILFKSEDFYIPLVKKNWYSKWKYLSVADHQYILYDNFSEYFRDMRVDLISNELEAKKLLGKYIIYVTKT